MRSYQYLSFYQREMALHLYHGFDRDASTVSLDMEMQPQFKV